MVEFYEFAAPPFLVRGGGVPLLSSLNFASSIRSSVSDVGPELAQQGLWVFKVNDGQLVSHKQAVLRPQSWIRNTI
jgi:hypothetical protein